MLSYQRLRGRVTVEYAVPALWFMRRVSDIIGVARREMLVGVLRPPFAAPRPEIRAHDRPARAQAVEDCAVDKAVEAILVGRRRFGIEAAAVARKAELLDNQRLAQLVCNRDVPGDVFAAVLLGGGP